MSGDRGKKAEESTEIRNQKRMVLTLLLSYIVSTFIPNPLTTAFSETDSSSLLFNIICSRTGTVFLS
jgi:hypothetical protein